MRARLLVQKSVTCYSEIRRVEIVLRWIIEQPTLLGLRRFEMGGDAKSFSGWIGKR
jgi:hypothetical protein